MDRCTPHDTHMIMLESQLGQSQYGVVNCNDTFPYSNKYYINLLNQIVHLIWKIVEE